MGAEKECLTIRNSKIENGVCVCIDGYVKVDGECVVEQNQSGNGFFSSEFSHVGNPFSSFGTPFST